VCQFEANDSIDLFLDNIVWFVVFCCFGTRWEACLCN